GLVENLLDEEPEHALGMDEIKARFDEKVKEKDDYPTGYFASPDGTQIALRVFTRGSGFGGGNDEALYRGVVEIAHELDPRSFHPAMTVEFGGDIPNAKAEKDALVHEARSATLLAALFVAGGIVWFYGSPWSLLLVGFP